MKAQFLQLMGRYSKDEMYNLECWNEMEEHYTSKRRFYHTLDHVEQMLVELEKVSAAINQLDSMLFSVFYHDIIYDPLKRNNEHQSALLFQKRISQTAFDLIDYCMAQIEATKDHKPSDDSDTNYLLDADLSILGSTSEVYTRYAENIRKEYFMYPGFMYRRGRKKFLKQLLHRESIFNTEFFRKAYEEKARENIVMELKALS